MNVDLATLHPSYPSAIFDIHLGYSAEHDTAYMKAVMVTEELLDPSNSHSPTAKTIKTAQRQDRIIRPNTEAHNRWEGWI